MLLRTRSILAQASLLVLIILAKGQNYDADYQVSDDEGDGSSGYTEEGQQPVDYSKYYNAEGGSPLSAQIQGRSDNGFVTPIEFSSFFGSPQFAFGASNNQETLKPIADEVKKEAEASGFVSEKDFKGDFSEYDNGFGAKDFFEQAQKQEINEEGEEEEAVEPKPGPSYISHRLPAKKAKYESEVETFKVKPSKFNRVKNARAEDEESLDDETDKVNYNFKPSPPLNLAQFQPTNPSKILEEVGKLSNLPYSPEAYQEINTQGNPTPYQKYSFQPAASTFGLKEAAILNNFQSTAAPFNPSYGKVASTSVPNYEYQPSEIVSESLRNKDCVKINKHVSDKSGKFNNQPMNCFVCRDAKTGGKYEQCSYTNEPTPKSYYRSTSFGNPEGYRNKRDESQAYVDPYEDIKSKSHQYYSRPNDFEKEFYRTPDLSKISEEYNYSPETYNSKEAEEKSYSEIQSEELLKKGEHCQKSHKNGVTCTVCKDPKTGANYEQCSYESAPNEKKYAYVKESKFDGDGNPIEEKVTGSTVPQPVVSDETSNSQPLRRSDEGIKEESDEGSNEKSDDVEEIKIEDQQTKTSNAKLVDDSPYDIPQHFEESTYKQQQAGVRGLDPELYGNSNLQDKSDETGPQKFTNFDEYHLKLFPHFNNEESQREETRTQPEGSYFEDLTGKKDVERVLEEFTKKDRSNCKQITKKGMTCYLCVDKKGIQQEECMFVSESRPQSSHVAYHEVQHLKTPKPNITEIQPIQEETSASEISKKKKFFKKATSVVPEDSEANASSNVETRIKYTPEMAAASNINKRQTKADRDQSSGKLDNSQDPQPLFDINDEGGLYTSETRPVYSRALGITLPKYMLDQSEMERDFDRTVSEE